jgi:hypothetical protein
MNINQTVFLIIIIIAIVIYIYNINQENFTNTQTANEAIQTMASIFTNQNATLGNLTTTGNITSAGNITSTGNITSSGIITSYANIGPDSGGSIFGHDNRTQAIGIGYNSIYTAGTTVDQPLDIKTKGKGNLGLISGGGAVNITGSAVNVTGNLIVNNGLWQPDYFRFQCFCNSSNCYYASDANTLASGNLNTYTDDSAKWYLMGYRIINKKYGTCITDPNNGNNSTNFILKPYDPNNKFQMFSKHHAGGNGYRIWGIGSGNWVGGWQDTTPLRRYFGSNGGDCNFGFVDIF